MEKKTYDTSKIHICPECGGTEFRVNAHISQGWLIDEDGSFISVTENCDQVIHHPSAEDIWQCNKCRLEKQGEAFCYTLYNESIAKLDLSAIASVLMSSSENEYFNLAYLLTNTERSSLSVSAKWIVEESRSWYCIHVIDDINAHDCYITDTEDASPESIHKELVEIMDATLDKYFEEKKTKALQNSQPLYQKLFQKLIEAFPEVGTDAAIGAVFCQNGDEILAMDVRALDAIDALFIQIGYYDNTTGYYDPDADERNCEVDRNTGYWYIALGE